ncbi:MAG: nuclear transport factor 2 family protein [Anaerolineae bacterium]|nr:nuclear transport factor 2 family protein [Anaerolineae bacterium]
MFTSADYETLMQSLAHAWSTQATEAALACFAEDAVYMEPPDIQLYLGHVQLRPYFAALKPGTYLTLHHIWFAEPAQTGAVEYSFGVQGRPQADHGCIVTQIRDGRIAFWREYQRKGPALFAEFLAPEGKTWQWHIGNYP